MTTKRIELPPRILEVFEKPRGAVRFRGARGGRGSGKSFNFAKMAAIWGAIDKMRILCTRELQVSIRESFHAELKNAIKSDEWLDSVYDVGIDYIRNKNNGTEFLFKGLRHGMGSVKSTAQIDLTIVEEAEDIPENAWVDLLPTIFRTEKAECWVIWNPRKKDSPVDKRFVTHCPDDAVMVEMNYCDNPFFPKGLEDLRKHDENTMPPELYAHVWLGAYYEHTEAQVFKNWKVQTIDTAGWEGPYFGLDFGFSQDPTAGVRCWIRDNDVYIEQEAGKVGLEIDHTSDYLIKRIDGIANGKVYGDSARPESISLIKRTGIPKIEGVPKWKGSVEDGVEWLRSKTVYINPECRESIKEFTYYSYKTDRFTGEVKNTLVDAYNHYIDAIRYCFNDMITYRKVPKTDVNPWLL
ncbi:terminase large subunit [Vibrio phage 381E49-1]|nr:terminase large subunit [Vibrio phage 381E49-1]